MSSPAPGFKETEEEVRRQLIHWRGFTYDEVTDLAVNTLDDKFDCSPAFVGDEMYLKGKQNLYCITASK